MTEIFDEWKAREEKQKGIYFLKECEEKD